MLSTLECRGVEDGLVVGLAVGVEVGLVMGSVYGLVVGLVFGLADAIADSDSTCSPSPPVSWHNERSYSIFIGLLFGLAGGLLVGLTVGLANGRANGLANGLVFGLLVGLASGLLASHVWSLSLAAAQLAWQWHTPLRFMSFLEDARERNVLRTVGPVYQFRHARLQDRLAAASDGNSDCTDQPAGCGLPRAHRPCGVPIRVSR